MITKRNISILIAFTIVCFVTAGVLGNDREGVLRAIADVSWFGFLLGILLLAVVGVARLGRWIGRRASTSPES
jgi:hypothetical protein